MSLLVAGVDLAAHEALATVHQNAPGLIGAGIAVHAGLTTGVHGAGAEILAVLADITGAIVLLDTQVGLLDIDGDSPDIGLTVIDASASVPAGTTHLILEVRWLIATTGTSGINTMQLRQNDIGNSIFLQLPAVMPNGSILRGMWIIGCDVDRKIQYSIAEATGAGGHAIDINLFGYLKGSRG